MASLETTSALQKDSNTDDSFSVDIPLKTKKGEYFIIEESSEFRLNSIDVASGKSRRFNPSGTQNKKPVFEIRNEGEILYRVFLKMAY